MADRLDMARHAQGLALYRSGKSISHVVALGVEIDEMRHTAKTQEDHEAITNAVPSIIAGFADGFLTDFREIAARLTAGGQRA